jgi:hypothetical protein
MVGLFEVGKCVGELGLEVDWIERAVWELEGSADRVFACSVHVSEAGMFPGVKILA